MKYLKKIYSAVAILCLMVSLPCLFPLTVSAAQVYEVRLDAAQVINSSLKLTGEMYVGLNGKPLEPFFDPFAYCVDSNMNLTLPGNHEPPVYYYGERQAIAPGSAMAQAAWLADNFAYSKKGEWQNLGDFGTGTAVQMAIWKALNMGLTYGDQYKGFEALFTQSEYMFGQLKTADLEGMENKYMVLQLYSKYENGVLSVPFQPILAPVPIPATIWLLGTALLGLAGFRRRKKR